MAPEQALLARTDICPATDIYALGAVMYAALVGRPPFVSADSQDLMLKLISQPPASLRQFALRVPRPLDAIVLKCLEKRPQQRYANAKELKSDLMAFAAGQPVKRSATELLDNRRVSVAQACSCSQRIGDGSTVPSAPQCSDDRSLVVAIERIGCPVE